MSGRRTAARTDDGEAEVPHLDGIAGHLLGGAIEDEGVALELGQPGIGLHHEAHPARARLGQLRGDDAHLVEAPAAVSTDDIDPHVGHGLHGHGGGDPHHRAEVGVEAERGEHGKAGSLLARCRDGRLDLGEVAHRLDEDAVDTTGDETADLLAEHLGCRVDGEIAHRLHELTRRSDVTEDEGAGMTVRHAAPQLGSSLVELFHAVLEPVHLESRAGATEGVGGEQSRTR